jgi:hypothetical protein
VGIEVFFPTGTRPAPHKNIKGKKKKNPSVPLFSSLATSHLFFFSFFYLLSLSPFSLSVLCLRLFCKFHLFMDIIPLLCELGEHLRLLGNIFGLILSIFGY